MARTINEVILQEIGILEAKEKEIRYSIPRDSCMLYWNMLPELIIKDNVFGIGV